MATVKILLNIVLLTIFVWVVSSHPAGSDHNKRPIGELFRNRKFKVEFTFGKNTIPDEIMVRWELFETNCIGRGSRITHAIRISNITQHGATVSAHPDSDFSGSFQIEFIQDFEYKTIFF